MTISPTLSVAAASASKSATVLFMSPIKSVSAATVLSDNDSVLAAASAAAAPPIKDSSPPAAP